MKSETQTPKTGWSTAEYAICGLAIAMITLGATFVPELKQQPLSLQLVIATLATIATVSTVAFLLSNRTIRQLRRDATDSLDKIITLGEQVVKAEKQRDAVLELLDPYLVAMLTARGPKGDNDERWNREGVGIVDVRTFLTEFRQFVAENGGIARLIELAEEGELPEALAIGDQALANRVSKMLRAATS